MFIQCKTGAIDFWRETCWFSVHVIIFSRKLLESYLELIRKFAKFNEDPIWDNNFELSQTDNIDETPLFMNILNTKTIVKIGSKDLISKINVQKRIHGTAILWIIADGTKSPNVSV